MLQILWLTLLPVRVAAAAIDVLWGQPIKLILFLLQNFMNIDGTTMILFVLSPPLAAGPQRGQKKNISVVPSIFMKF